MTTSLTGSAVDFVGFGEPDLEFLAGGGGEVLPTWSARMGSSRWPRSISTARRTIRGAAEVNGDRVEGGPDGPSEYRTSYNQHHHLVVDAGAGKLGGVGRAHSWCERSSRNMVTSSWPTIAAGSTWDGGGNLGGQAGRRGDRPGVDTEQDQVLGALVGRQDLMGDTSECTVDVRLVKYHSGEYNLGRNRCFWNRSQRSSPLSPPHGTELKKDCLRSQITTAAPAPRSARMRLSSHGHRLESMTTNDPRPGPDHPG